MPHFLRQFFRFLTYPIRAIFASPKAILSAPSRLLGISLPARVAIFIALLLVLTTVTAFLTYLWGDFDGTYWDIWFRWPRVVLIPGLIVVIPIVVYYALRLWLEGERSAYPDIDAAWQAGVEALALQGLDVRNIPLYLVVGTGNETQASDLFSASQLDFEVQHVPQGAKALHWYANSNAIYLCCTKASCVGLLAARAADESGHAALLPTAAAQGADPIRGTIIAGVDASSGLTGPSPDATGDAGFDAPNVNFRGTIAIGQGADEASFPGKSGAAPASAGQLHRLLTKDADQQADRLRYVCRLIQRARQPVCPINGIVTLLPFHVLQQSDAHGSEVLVGARVDLETIRNAVRLRCPAIALVGGMETQPGFRELVRRVGRDAARQSRFGKGYNVWCDPSDEQVEAVVRNACGAFEDFAYHLFKEKGGLSHKGNAQLYSLLCFVRNHLEQRLVNILVGVYAPDTEEAASHEPLMFGGCYFAATGGREDHQAFVRGVLQGRLIDESLDSELEWTRQAIAEDARYQGFANFLTVVCGLLVLTSVGLFIAWLAK